MNYRIEKKDAFRVIGLSIKLNPDPMKNTDVIKEFWMSVSKTGTITKLLN